MNITESVFPPSSHPESPDSCQGFVLVTVVGDAMRPSWCSCIWSVSPESAASWKAGQQTCCYFLCALYAIAHTKETGAILGLTFHSGYKRSSLYNSEMLSLWGKLWPMGDRNWWKSPSLFLSTGGLFWEMIIPVSSLKMSLKNEWSTALAPKLWPAWECTTLYLLFLLRCLTLFLSVLLLWDDSSH